jgi:hypothetical protein
VREQAANGASHTHRKSHRPAAQRWCQPTPPPPLPCHGVGGCSHLGVVAPERHCNVLKLVRALHGGRHGVGALGRGSPVLGEGNAAAQPHPRSTRCRARPLTADVDPSSDADARSRASESKQASVAAAQPTPLLCGLLHSRLGCSCPRFLPRTSGTPCPTAGEVGSQGGGGGGVAREGRERREGGEGTAKTPASTQHSANTTGSVSSWPRIAGTPCLRHSWMRHSVDLSPPRGAIDDHTHAPPPLPPPNTPCPSL